MFRSSPLLLLYAGCSGLALVAGAVPLHAQQTPAGTRISNTAVLTRTSEGRTTSVDSNTVALTVETLVDVAVAAQAESIRVSVDGRVTVVGFDIVNTGNATERYALAATGDGSPIAVHATAEGGTALADLDLKPGERRTVHVVVDGAATTRTVTLSATATTGHGAPGTAFPGAGVAGTVAIVGPGGASASATTVLIHGTAQATLTKTATVLAPNGTARAMPGAIITYRLDAASPDDIRDAAIVDPVPDGTEYIPGSILLDDRPLTDAADGDAAGFDGAAVRVALGDIAAGRTRSVRFQVRIK